ncbi:MAG TPA: ECF-type sigma factor [Anaeromyxobacteraceae bacterium]|nr:ECF-type sigma factor [Anaeromyxobacteraceae bacterium]
MVPSFDAAVALAAAPGSEAALQKLVPLVYSNLRALASRFLARERGASTLSPTTLVHEAYLRLREQPGVRWRGQAHLLALAACMMRRVLVNHAVARRRLRRGGGWQRVTLDTGLGALGVPAEQRALGILEIDAALQKLSALDGRQARVVEMRCFGGMTVEEIAAALELSPATIKREWATARLWLARELS